jgi:hypothetical protein
MTVTSAYAAETDIAGKRYGSTSRHGAPNALARVLVEAGIADDTVEVRYAGVAGCMSYRSLHAIARFTYSEGNTPLRRVPYVAREAGSWEPTAGVLPEPSPASDAVAAPQLSVTCEGCDQSFTPKRSDARTCGPACRKRISRRSQPAALDARKHSQPKEPEL